MKACYCGSTIAQAAEPRQPRGNPFIYLSQRVVTSNGSLSRTRRQAASRRRGSAPEKGSPEGVCGPLPCAAQAAPQVSNRGTLGAGGAWILPGEPPSLLNGCARPRRSPPHNSPVDFHSRLDHLLSRRTHHAGPRTRYREPAADCRPAARSAPPGSPVGIGARGGLCNPDRLATHPTLRPKGLSTGFCLPPPPDGRDRRSTRPGGGTSSRRCTPGTRPRGSTARTARRGPAERDGPS